MEQNKIIQLQGLRGFAIIGIFIFHTQTFLYDPSGTIWNLIIDQLGTIGVIVFFMLSGFLLVYKKKVVPKLNWKDRIKVCRSKFNKMYFLYILTMILAFLGKLPQSTYDYIYSVISLPLNLTYTQDLIPLVNINISYNGPAWFISAMFIIWIIVYSIPSLINKVWSLDLKSCLLGIFFIIIIQVIYKFFESKFPVHLIPINHHDIYMSWISYYSPFYNFGFFILGGFIGRITLLNQTESIKNVYLLFMCVMLFLIVCLLYDFVFFNNIKAMLYESVICMTLLLIMSPNSFLRIICSLRPLVWFGNISASMFLIHGAVNYNLRYLETYISKPWLFFVSLLLTVILSILSEKYLILKKNENVLQRIRKIA